MKRGIPVFVACSMLLAGLAVFSGCNDDDGGTKPNLVTVADLAGSWTVTKYQVTHQTIPEMTLDFVQLGAVITIDAQASGLFTGQAVMVDPISQQQTTIPFAGNFTLDGDTVTGTFTPEIPPYFTSFGGPYTYDGDTIEITDAAATFDFDGDQQQDPAIAVVALARQ
jgi:hypothetical protein